MSGESAVRKAEDVGGQELSYAEVKAIASGNPAVLTLAEADAELQRLSILRKNHTDEQYLAKRARGDLPGTINRYETRIEGLTADMATLSAHQDDPLPSMEGLGNRLNRLPEKVSETRRFPLGQYRGLNYGLVLHPLGTDVFLDGAVTRRVMIRDNPGPRAVLNALERLADGYAAERDRTRQDLGIAENQLRDYEARLGQPFRHAGYLDQLAALRDQLKAGLSGAERKEGEPTVSDLAEQIKALRAANTIESAPERTVARKIAGEEPVTARIRRRMEEPTPLVEETEVAANRRVAALVA